jgi:hypothetical protein
MCEVCETRALSELQAFNIIPDDLSACSGW